MLRLPLVDREYRIGDRAVYLFVVKGNDRIVAGLFEHFEAGSRVILFVYDNVYRFENAL